MDGNGLPDLDWANVVEVNRGAQGVVYRVSSRSGAHYAVKTRVAENEIDMLSRLRHPNIVKLINICTYENRPAMLMEYVDRNLRQHLDRGMLNKRSFLEITQGIAEGLSFMHEQGIVHRDVKSENILIQLTTTGRCIPKIGDLGIARDVPKKWTRMQIIGSYNYMAPELLAPQRIEATDADATEERMVQLAKLEPRQDTWSFGCLSWEILTSLSPFYNCTQDSLPMMVSKGHFRIPVPHEATVESLGNMFLRCLVITPDSRSTMADVVELLAGVNEDVQSMSDEEWRAEQQKYLDEVEKHGFKARSATDMLRTRDLQMRKRAGDFLKDAWDNYFRQILKNLLKLALMLSGDSEASATATVVWLSDRLHLFGQSEGYRTFARAVERPIGYVLINIPILLRDGHMENFIPFWHTGS